MSVRTRALLTLVALLLASAADAAPRSAGDSAELVRRWLDRGDRFSLVRSRRVSEVVNHRFGETGARLHEIRFERGGFAVTDPEDPTGGVLAFSDSGALDEDPDNPLWTLLARHMERRQSAGTASAAITSADGLSDLRVEPLVESKWNQRAVGGALCFNYHTPSNWHCGCVATALGQIMRYHEWPQDLVTPQTNTCFVGTTREELAMFGGTYDWRQMPLVPSAGDPDAARETIGRLTYDIGVAVHTRYGASGSSAIGAFAFDPLVNVFGYASAAYYQLESVTNQLERAEARNVILANLDARSPVLLSIAGEGGENGHAVVVDGYGYADGTCYAHLNMGWSGLNDAWYALPEIGTSYGFCVADGVVYNIFPRSRGAVVSGRITDHGEAFAGVTVTAYDNRRVPVAETVSDVHGVYALVLGESATYTVVASDGELAATNVVTTGRMATITITDWVNGEYVDPFPRFSCGNRWGNDFALGRPREIRVDASAGSDTTGTGAELAPYATVSNALARAGARDTIVVEPGRYGPVVNASLTDVTIRSTGGAAVTVVDGGMSARCVDDYGNLRWIGFTFANGCAEGDCGGGVVGGTYEACVVSNCLAEAGGGAYGAILYNCLLADNSATLIGGGAADSILVNCTVVGNASAEHGGGLCLDRVGGAVNCVFSDNVSASGFTYGDNLYDARLRTAKCFFGGDPGFVDASGGDFRLASGSPCLDAGAADWVLGETDLAGAARTSGAAVDLGCYEAARPVAFAERTLQAGAAGQTNLVRICAEGDWTLVGDAAWLEPLTTAGSGSTDVWVRVAANTSGVRREGVLTLSDGTAEASLAVTQALGTPRGGRHYGLFVGIDSYDRRFISSRYWISGAVRAVTNMQALCFRSGLWHPGAVTLLANGAATKAAIRDGLATLAATARPGDVVLYCQAGLSDCAAYDRCSVAFCAYDGYYADTELAEDLRKFAPGVKVIVIADAGYAGGLYRLPAACEPYADAGDIAFLTATDFDQLAAGLSFSSALHDGWEDGSADLDGDGRLDFGELFAFAVRRTAPAPGTDVFALAEPRCFNAALLGETLAEVVDPQWPDPTAAGVGATLLAAGYSEAIAAAVETTTQYAGFAKWIETAGVTPTAANAAETAVLSAAVRADGLLRADGIGLRITALDRISPSACRIDATLAAMEGRLIDAELLANAFAVKTSEKLEELPRAEPSPVVVTPSPDAFALEFDVPATTPSRFFQLLPR